MIDWDKRLVCETLRAVEAAECEAGRESGECFLEFDDHRLKYTLIVSSNTGSVFLAADPDRPMSPMPMFEVSFRCQRIHVRPSAYGASPGNAVCFYELADCSRSVRLTLEPTVDGNWYLWAHGSHEPTAGGA